MLKKSVFSPAQPRRAETRPFPGVVLASFRPSTYRKGTPRAFTRCGLADRPFWASCWGPCNLGVARGWDSV